MLKTIHLSRIFSLFLIVISFNLAFAQNERMSPLEDSLFVVNTNRLTQLLEKIENSLTQKQANESFSACFLNLEEAQLLTKIVYQGSQNAHDSVRFNAISLFYNKISNQAKDQLSAYQGDLKSIELFSFRKRFGASEYMKVIVVSLNMELNDGNKQGLKLNIVELGNDYKILNFED